MCVDVLYKSEAWILKGMLRSLSSVSLRGPCLLDSRGTAGQKPGFMGILGLTLVVLESPLGTRVLPGWIVRSSRPPSPPGGLLRVGPGRAQPTVVRESSKVNWLNVCRPCDGHPCHPTWTTPPAGKPVLHMLVEQ